MDAFEPRLRRRGFFLHSSEGEADTGEHENPEGFIVRVRVPRHSRIGASRRATAGARFSGGRSHHTDSPALEGQPSIRSGGVTGSRQRAHLPR